MENFFRKYGRVVNLAIIALVAFLLAMITNTFIASRIAKYTVPTVPKVAASKGATKTRRPTRTSTADRVGVIARRCLFLCDETDASTEKTCKDGCKDGEVCEEGKCVPKPQVDPELLNGLPVRSDLNIKLNGVMVARPSEYSSAIVLDPSQQNTLIVRIGDTFAGGTATLLEVYRDRIIFQRNGRKEYITLAGTIAGDPSPTARSPLFNPTLRKPSALNAPGPALNKKPPTAKERATRVQPGDTAIKRISSNSYVLPKRALEDALKNRAKLMSDATFSPSYKNNKLQGIRLMNVKSDSGYASLGLRSGDLVREINGTAITSQIQALGLLEKARSSGKLRIVLDRSGARQNMTYTIK